MKNKNVTQQLAIFSAKQKNLTSYFYAKNFAQALKVKGILISSFLFSEKEKQKRLHLELFYKAQKIKNYKYKLEKQKKKGQTYLKALSLLNNKSAIFTFNVLNPLLKKDELTKLFKLTKKNESRLFIKRNDLFCDLLKVISLVAEQKASVWILSHLLNMTFKPLRKKNHAIFISFVKEIFEHFIKSKNQNHKIKGVKFILSGRIKGKPRANIAKFHLGKIPLNQESLKIGNSQEHIYTRYGCFGLKLWINFG